MSLYCCLCGITADTGTLIVVRTAVVCKYTVGHRFRFARVRLPPPSSLLISSTQKGEFRFQLLEIELRVLINKLFPNHS
jgi:hypothetical protein